MCMVLFFGVIFIKQATTLKKYIITVAIAFCTVFLTALFPGTNHASAAAQLKTPVIYAPANRVNGVKVAWKAVSGAKKYRVFLKNGKTWKKIGDTAATSLIHTSAVSGTKYTYTVRCIGASGKYVSSFDPTGRSVTYYKAPTISATTNTYAGIKLQWDNCRGVKNYRVFLKNGTTWKRVADVSTLTYTYPKAESGKRYTFTVRALSADKKQYISAYNSGKTVEFIKAPTVTKLNDSAAGGRITFTPCAGAAAYRVYYKVNNAWTVLGDTTGSIYVHTDVLPGTEYTYTVRCLNEAHQVISGFYAAGWTHRFQIPSASLIAPDIISTENIGDTTRISWEPSQSAQKYRVLVKTGGDWQILGEAEETCFDNTHVTPGVSYTYAIACISANGALWMSSCGEPATTTFVKAPEVRLSSTSNGVKLSWDTCPGAEGYRVFECSGEEPAVLGDTTRTCFIHTGAPTDTDCTYRVAPLYADGELANRLSTAATIHYTTDPDSFAMTPALFSAEVCELLGRDILPVTEPNAPLTRRSAAQILMKCLGYKARNAVALSDAGDDTALLTIAYYGWFLPDDADRIHPDAVITADEYGRLITEVQRYAQLRGKRILAFGDSIMAGKGNDYHGIARMTAEKYGMSCISYAISGATLSHCANKRYHIFDQISAGQSDGATGDVILLNGGTNDLSLLSANSTIDRFDPSAPAESDLAQGLNAILKQITQTWKDIPVIYVRAHDLTGVSDTLERQVGECCLDIAAGYHAAIVDIYSDTELNMDNTVMCDRFTLYDSVKRRHDGIHPNALGYAEYYLPLVGEKLSEAADRN